MTASRAGVLGLIPAYAGSTFVVFGGVGADQAHPRLRGEHDGKLVERTDIDGSSPLTRGARRGLIVRRGAVRLIPAYAGSTGASRHRTHRVEAHPRLRGEHRNRAHLARRDYGSSPLTRGARPALWRLHEHGRLIPAYAGSTLLSSANT